MNKTKIIVCVIALLAAYGFGRFSGPTKVVEKTVTVTDTKTDEKKNETKDTDKNIKKDKVYIKLETILPDGTHKIETRIVDKGTVTIDSSSTAQTDTKTDTKTETTHEKTVERSAPSVTIYGIAGLDVTHLLSSAPAYGVGVQKRIFGPITIGAFGLSNGLGAITAGLQF